MSSVTQAPPRHAAPTFPPTQLASTPFPLSVAALTFPPTQSVPTPSPHAIAAPPSSSPHPTTLPPLHRCTDPPPIPSSHPPSHRHGGFGNPSRIINAIIVCLCLIPFLFFKSECIQPLETWPNNPTAHPTNNNPISSIDLSNAVREADFLRIEISAACGEWGAFHMTNHGVPPKLLDEIRRMGRKFFEACPMDEKLRYSCNTSEAATEVGTAVGLWRVVNAVEWWEVRHRLQPQPRRLHPLRQLPPARLLRRPRRLYLHFTVKQCQYKVLGLGGDCTADEICSAYRRLAFQHHPDKLAQFGISPAAYRRPALQAYQTSPFP
ncbi:hypothetical protein RJ640_016197 [Escallonia rubra]|uniref:J domain-containing protein n=1 Tax=Escallonia rubra TaxID=112253 RepID=A0AA88QZR3_9ASTE|nr:hypothetical protein RJ640_016197 [Escallonia rubra]